MRSPFVALGLLVAGCLDLTLPAERATLPGTVSATVFVQRVGSASLTPAEGAVLELVGTGRRAVADAEGNVRLDQLTTSAGTLRLGWDATGDGVDESSRLFDLQLIGAGRGHDVSLGVVVLGRLASVTGVARRADHPGPSGHGGIQVFVPESPAATQTADDGSYTLAGLPEGAVPLTYFAPGYAPVTNRVQLGAGRSERLAEVALSPSVDLRTAMISGVVRQAGQPVADARVDVLGTERTTVSASDGTWRFDAVPAGLVTLRFVHDGYAVLRLPNVLVLAGATLEFDVSLVAGDADAGVELDAGLTPPPTRGPVQIVSVVGSQSSAVDGGVQLVPPGLSLPGDLVVALVTRPDPRFNFMNPTVALTAEARGWHRETTSTLPPSLLDQVHVLWRFATADEQARLERYWFEAPNGAEWVLLVLRGASGLAAVRSVEGTSPVVFTAVSGAEGDLVVDAFSTGGRCTMATDGGVVLEQFGGIQLYAGAVGASGELPAVTLDCANGPLAGRVEQLRVFAAP